MKYSHFKYRALAIGDQIAASGPKADMIDQLQSVGVSLGVLASTRVAIDNQLKDL